MKHSRQEICGWKSIFTDKDTTVKVNLLTDYKELKMIQPRQFLSPANDTAGRQSFHSRLTFIFGGGSGLHPTRLFPCYNCYFVNPTPTHLYTSVYSQLYLQMSVRQSFCPRGGGESHVAITHDAFELTIQRLPNPAPSVQGPSWPRSCPTPSTWIFSTWTSSYKGPRHIQTC